VPAGIAAQVDEAVFGITASQKVAKGLFDELREPVPALGGIGEKVIELVCYD